MTDNFNLERFIDAQNPVFDEVTQELENGEKESHWMWFIFPQIHSLGYSSTSKFYAIKSIEEANGYLTHPILGARLEQCCKVHMDLQDISALGIFEEIDEQKLLSSMTLFASIEGDKALFEAVLNKYFNGEKHEETLVLLDA